MYHFLVLLAFDTQSNLISSENKFTFFNTMVIYLIDKIKFLDCLGYLN